MTLAIIANNKDKDINININKETYTMSITFDLGSKKTTTGNTFAIYPEGDSEAVCFNCQLGSEMRTQRIDTKGTEDQPAPGVKLKGWGHVHQNTNTGKLFKDHGNEQFDWREVEPEYEFKFLQFFFCSKEDYYSTYPLGLPEKDSEGKLVTSPKGAWVRSRKMTASAAANSALRNFLRNWGVNVPAPDAWEELKKFDIESETVGRGAKLNVIHNVGNKHTFANINTCHKA